MANLTPSKKHYIKTIYILSPDNQGVQITEIADKLEVTKASVCTAMKTLQEDDFIFRGKKRFVYLTEKGEILAFSLTEKYEVIRCFLIEILQMDNETAEQDACAIEHVISTETLCSICRYPNRKCMGECYIKTD